MAFTVVPTDNRGFGCVNRLQAEHGGTPSNTPWESTVRTNNVASIYRSCWRDGRQTGSYRWDAMLKTALGRSLHAGWALVAQSITSAR